MQTRARCCSSASFTRYACAEDRHRRLDNPRTTDTICSELDAKYRGWVKVDGEVDDRVARIGDSRDTPDAHLHSGADDCHAADTGRLAGGASQGRWPPHDDTLLQVKLVVIDTLSFQFRQPSMDMKTRSRMMELQVSPEMTLNHRVKQQVGKATSQRNCAVGHPPLTSILIAGRLDQPTGDKTADSRQ